MKYITWQKKQQFNARQRKANANLSMLEKSGQTKYAYNSSMQDIKRLGGTDRFPASNESDSDKFFQTKWNAIENFLNKSSSSPRKRKEVGNKIANTLNKKYPSLGFTPDNIDEFFDSKMWEELKKSYASDTILRGLGKLKQEEASIKKQVSLPFGEYNMTNKYRNVSVREFVEDMVNEKGYNSLNELYKGFGFSR